jgi:hypothetical protein
MHLIIFLHHNSKLRTPEDIDSLVSADLPDPDTQPELSLSSQAHSPWSLWYS